MMRVLALILAAASAQAVIVHPGPLPTEWLAAPLPASAAAQEIGFSVALREQNMAELKRIALAVSDPQTPEYGKHRSAAEVAELTAPTAADTATVRSWLAASACNVVAARSRAAA